MGIKETIIRKIRVPVGRSLGYPEIQHSSPLINGGNFLYYWMYAYNQKTKGIITKVQYQESITGWLAEFPVLQNFSIKPTRWNRLLSDWHGSSPDIYGRDFTREQIDEFSKFLINSSPSFQRRIELAQNQMTEDTCVVNIRRGDYYQYQHLIDMYGLNNIEYIKEAIEFLPSNINRFFLVSDDLEWCFENIAPLLPGEVVAHNSRQGMFEDLASLIAAPALVLANSTFSFWGGHMRDALSGHKGITLAPPYHFRNEDGSDNYLRFDPHWKRVPINS